MKSPQWMAGLSVLLCAGSVGASAQGGIGSGNGTGTIQATILYSSTSKGHPYSADVVHESNQVLADGNRIHTETHSKIFRDSEGRTRNENEFDLGGVKRTNVTIFDPVAQLHIILDPQNKTATLNHFRSPASAVAGHAMPHPAAAGAGTRPTSTSEDLGSKEIEGIIAFGTRRVEILGAGSVGNEKPLTVVREWWVSRELSITLLSSTDDPRSGQNTTRMINIQRGEPDPQLFQVPTDYTVKDIPSQQ